MPPRVGVVLASASRPTELAEAIESIASSSFPNLRVVVSVPSSEDVPVDAVKANGVHVVTGLRGLPAQRNAGLDALPPDTDFVFFFDDDALIRGDYIANAVNFLEANENVMGITGTLLADGAILPHEVSAFDAKKLLAKSLGLTPTKTSLSHKQLYGCNFGGRFPIIAVERFDETLPLYGWLEDLDMARRLLRYGRLAKLGNSIAVHRGVRSGGRTKHKRLGYSQVANPWHLWRKGSFPLYLMVRELSRPALKNLALAFIGRDRTARRARLAGNLLAFTHIITRKVDPQFALEISE